MPQIHAPKLDQRTHIEFYAQTIELAKSYCQIWTSLWPSTLNPSMDGGIVMLKLFSILAEYLVKQLNQVPTQRQLAFLNFLNVNSHLINPARVPVVFDFIKIGPAIKIPKTTQVKQINNNKMIFQTIEEMFALPVKISVGIFVDPFQDEYLDASELIAEQNKSFYLFGSLDDVRPLNHSLYLGDGSLFANDGSIEELQIDIMGKNITEEYFTDWLDGNAKTLKIKSYASAKQMLTITFSDLPNASKLDIGTVIENAYGAEAIAGGYDLQDFPKTNINQTMQSDKVYWVSVQPRKGLKILKSFSESFPQITKINCHITTKCAFPDLTMANTTVVNIKNGAYPFGQIPNVNDAFYIASDAILSKASAIVNLEFEFQCVPMPNTEQITAKLFWEYWNGKDWQSFNDTEAHINIYGFKDIHVGNMLGGNNNPKGQISFICPKIIPTKIGNQMKYWIRVRIDSGVYGSPLGIVTSDIATVVDNIPGGLINNKAKLIDYFNNQAGINFGFKISNAKYTPPFIKSIKISYKYTASPELTVIHNNFVTESLIFSPYIALPDEHATFYIGFQIVDFEAQAVNQPLTLYFPISNLPAVSDLLNEKNTSIIWEYLSKNGWQKLHLKSDMTYGLRTDGIITFIVPKDIINSFLFGNDLFWFRIIDTKEQDISPRIKSIYPNAVYACNQLTIKNEILGSGTGEPSQKFVFSQKGILAQPMVATLESSNSPQLPIVALASDSFANQQQATITKTELNTILWQEVDSFCFSDSTSRHYILNHRTGEINFGDGTHGMPAPRGNNNIIALEYNISNGGNGNIPANTLTLLQDNLAKTLRANNPIASYSGVDEEGHQEIIKYGPQQVKSCNRAVSAQDFTNLVMQASSQIVRATTQAHWDKNVHIYILPKVPATKPEPHLALIQDVLTFVRKRAPVWLANNIYVSGPVYHLINSVVHLKLQNNSQTHQVKVAVTNILTTFLNSLCGGVDGTGWDFGAFIDVVNITMMIRKIAGVAEVLLLQFNDNEQGIKLAQNELPYAGGINIVVFSEPGAIQ